MSTHYLCCDGPLNGDYVKMERELPVGTVVEIELKGDVLPAWLEDRTYKVVQWPTNEVVLVWTKAILVLDDFAETADEHDAEFDFPTKINWVGEGIDKEMPGRFGRSVTDSLGAAGNSPQTIKAREQRQAEPGYEVPRIRYLRDIVREAVMDAEVRS